MAHGGGFLCWRSEPETLAVGKLERLEELFVDRLSARRNVAAAKAFRKAIRGQQRPPHTITMDGYAASHSAVCELKADGCLPTETKLRSSKYLNNLIEQNHRSVKQRVAVMPEFNRSSTRRSLSSVSNRCIAYAKDSSIYRVSVSRAELRPQPATQYSECEGSVAHPIRRSACASLHHIPLHLVVLELPTQSLRFAETLADPGNPASNKPACSDRQASAKVMA
jgi:hypothetical protein